MKRIIVSLFVFLFVVGMSSWSLAAGEHGGAQMDGKEHGGAMTGSPMEPTGAEHGGTAMTTPSNDDIRATMKAYVMAQSEKTGTFDILDPDTGAMRSLKLMRVHERVGKTGDYYYSCADFSDVNSGELLDLDLDVEDNNGLLSVVDVRIHKVEDEARYTYDADDNRIPLKEGTVSHMGKGSPMEGSSMEHGGATMDHDGHEHGGSESGAKEHGGL